MYAYIKTPTQKLFHIRTQYFQQIQGKSDPVSVLTFALFWSRFNIYVITKLFKHQQEKTAVFWNIGVFIVEVSVVSHPLMLHSPRCCRTTSLQRRSSGMQKWAISRRRRLWRFLANNRDTRCAEESGEVLRDRSKNTACRQILSAGLASSYP